MLGSTDPGASVYRTSESGCNKKLASSQSFLGRPPSFSPHARARSMISMRLFISGCFDDGPSVRITRFPSIP